MNRTRRRRNPKSRRKGKRGRKRMPNRLRLPKPQTVQERQRMGKSPSGMRMLHRGLKKWKMSKRSCLLANDLVSCQNKQCRSSNRGEHRGVGGPNKEQHQSDWWNNRPRTSWRVCIVEICRENLFSLSLSRPCSSRPAPYLLYSTVTRQTDSSHSIPSIQSNAIQSMAASS